MHLSVYLSDGGRLEVADFDAASALDLAEALDTQQTLTFEMDDATVLVNRDHVVRIDIDDDSSGRG